MGTRHKGSEREIRALDAFIKLNRAVETVNARLAPGLAAAGMTQAQLAVLEALFHLGPMSQRDIGRKLLRSNPNVTAVIGNLERDGLVTRVRSTTDRRVVVVSLTAAGRTKIERAFPAHAARIADLFDVLDTDEIERLAALAKKLGHAAARASEDE